MLTITGFSIKFIKQTLKGPLFSFRVTHLQLWLQTSLPDVLIKRWNESKQTYVTRVPVCLKGWTIFEPFLVFRHRQWWWLQMEDMRRKILALPSEGSLFEAQKRSPFSDLTSICLHVSFLFFWGEGWVNIDQESSFSVQFWYVGVLFSSPSFRDIFLLCYNSSWWYVMLKRGLTFK